MCSIGTFSGVYRTTAEASYTRELLAEHSTSWIPTLQNHQELPRQFRFVSSPQPPLRCSGNLLTSLIRMESLQNTQLFSPKLGLVPPTSTLPLAVLLFSTLKVKLIHWQYLWVVNTDYHFMQVYKNTQGIMQGLLHQLNTEEEHCLMWLYFRPWRMVSDKLMSVTLMKEITFYTYTVFRILARSLYL